MAAGSWSDIKTLKQGEKPLLLDLSLSIDERYGEMYWILEARGTFFIKYKDVSLAESQVPLAASLTTFSCHFVFTSDCGVYG